MRILAVNLLRLGDLIAAAPALKVLRTRYPNATIDLMLNSNFASVAPLIASIDGVVLFERDRLQRATVEADRGFFEAYDWLNNFIEDLREHEYDLIVNFTHNRLSGWLCGMLRAKEKIGLAMDGSGAVSFGSAWFRQLNLQVDLEDRLAFNHTDVFVGALGGLADYRITTFDATIRETPEGMLEAQSLLGNEEAERIAIQLSTSDAKKEWGDTRWADLVKRVLVRKPKATFYILGAPNEVSRLRQFCDSIPDAGARLRPAIVSLAGAVSLLEEMDLLLTGDTSIKHLASAGSVPVIELALGSSDPYRTGSWKIGDWIVRSREHCAPCGHSESCHRPSHICAEGMQAQAIAKLTVARLDGAKDLKAILSDSENRVIQALVVDRHEGASQLLPFVEELTEDGVADRVERTVRRLAVETRDERFNASTFGTETRKARMALQRSFSRSTATELRHVLGTMELRLRHAEGMVQSLDRQVQDLREAFQSPARMMEVVRAIAHLRGKLSRAAATRFVAEALVPILEDDRSAPFTRYRKLQDAVSDLTLRLELSLKLVRGLEIDLEIDMILDMEG